MGEVLQGPWARRSGSDEGAGRRPAPSRRPADQAVAETADIAVPSHEPLAPEARWAVPGVDGDTSAETSAPTPRSPRAENVAIATLTRHDASEGEIRAKLKAKGLDEAEVEGELDRLRRTGLVDDAAFARRLVDRLRDRKGLGDSAIRSALRGRLVPQAVVDAVLAEQQEDADAVEARLQQAADDRARRLGSLAYDVAERRLMAYLMRKGYSGSAVRAATRTALDAAGIR